MTTKAKGPYKIVTDQDGYYSVVIPSGRGRFALEDTAEKICTEMNEAHTSQSVRMKELEDLLKLCKDVIEDDLEERPAIISLREALEAAGFPKDKNIYYGGLRTAKVTTVHGPFRIDEYDGFESVIEISRQEWIS